MKPTDGEAAQGPAMCGREKKWLGSVKSGMGPTNTPKLDMVHFNHSDLPFWLVSIWKTILRAYKQKNGKGS